MSQTWIERTCFGLAAVIFLLAFSVLLNNQDSVIGIGLLIAAALCARVLVIDVPDHFDRLNQQQAQGNDHHAGADRGDGSLSSNENSTAPVERSPDER